MGRGGAGRGDGWAAPKERAIAKPEAAAAYSGPREREWREKPAEANGRERDVRGGRGNNDNTCRVGNVENGV